MKLLAFLARLVGALLSLVVDLRRVKCRSHYVDPMAYPPRCMTCWRSIP